MIWVKRKVGIGEGRRRMIKINIIDNYYEYVEKNPNKLCIIYGGGQVTRDNYNLLGRIDYICDRNASNMQRMGQIDVLLPEQLKELRKPLIILICVQNKNAQEEICKQLDDLGIEAEVFCVFRNDAFKWFMPANTSNKHQYKEKLNIRLVYKNDGWILGKFAGKLYEELNNLGQDVSVDSQPDLEADVNHYISYIRLNKYIHSYEGVSTTMITHIDTAYKARLIGFQADNGTTGICMSKSTMNQLVSWGIAREKLCYVNPAHDGLIKPKKIVLGITNRCYGKEDFRKRDELLYEVCKQIEPEFFELKIMGAGWEKIVNGLRKLGFEVTYYPDFNLNIYYQLMLSLDYWLYYGFDEGAMGYLDAMAAGIGTIVTPQGYHLDTRVKPTFLCSTVKDFEYTLKKIQSERQERIFAVKDWTWESYAKKHLEIWKYLTKTSSLKEIYKNQSIYEDGIFSMLIENNAVE